MFQILRDPQVDWMGKRRVIMMISAVLVLASIALLAARGLNWGIEFTGGTELQLKYAEDPDITSIRSALNEAFGTTPAVTDIGDEADYEVYIKLGAAPEAGGEAGDEGDMTQQAIDALRRPEDRQKREAGLLDLNVADEGAVRRLLAGSSGIGAAEAEPLAAAILRLRKQVAIFHSFDELSSVPGLTESARSSLEQGTFLGSFALRSQAFIGPVVGEELWAKAKLAIVGSLIGMLLYIWVRFQFQWGLAAVVTLTHDTLLTLGLFSLVGKEMSLPVVAAFLTLVGYSINDTVVVFDRIRENLRKKGARNMEDLVNRSINQTLSRTIITSGSTWLVVVGLYVYGGEALSAFSFVLAIGILVGTYSSIYIASPLVVMWQRWAQSRKGSAGAAGDRPTRRATKKVRENHAG